MEFLRRFVSDLEVGLSEYSVQLMRSLAEVGENNCGGLVVGSWVLGVFGGLVLRRGSGDLLPRVLVDGGECVGDVGELLL